MSVRTATLSNGLRIVSHRMDTVETVSLGVWVNVGARFESADINGVSHLLEHMAFKGTERRSARDIAEEIEAVGGHLNAYTSREVTAYHATVLKDDTALAVEIIADILQNSVFDETELERERAVVLQEIGQTLDTPDDVIFDHFQATAYPGQSIGRSILGPPEIVGVMARDVLRNYMKTHYTAPRMVVAAAGNFDHDAFIGQVERAFDRLGGGNGDAPEAARYGGGEAREVRELEQVHLVLGFDGVSYKDDDYYAAAVTSTILGGGMSSRLFQEIREKLGLVYAIYSFNAAYMDGGLFGIYAGTGPDEVPTLVPALCDELMRAADGVTDKEVMRARAQLRAGMLMSLESTAARAEQLARQMMVFDRPLPIEEINQKIDAVDGAAVTAAMRRLLATRPTLAALGPVKNLEAFETVVARLGGAGTPA